MLTPQRHQQNITKHTSSDHMAENITTTFYEETKNITNFHCTHHLKQNIEQSTAANLVADCVEMIQSKNCKFLCSTPLQFLGRG